MVLESGEVSSITPLLTGRLSFVSGCNVTHDEREGVTEIVRVFRVEALNQNETASNLPYTLLSGNNTIKTGTNSETGVIVFPLKFRREYSLIQNPQSGGPYLNDHNNFTSTTIGIAIKEGYIENINQKVIDFFPDQNIQNLDSRKKLITIEHLLTMSTGLDWTHSLSGTTEEMYGSSDWVQFVLNRPMISDPGEEWNYNGGASHLLSAIISKTTGKSAYDFAKEFLFDTLNITSVSWPSDSQGNSMGYTDLYMSPRDMAKFGYLFLNNGSWDGQQILTEEWVTESTKSHFIPYEGQGYGYQWWTIPGTDIYQASGLYGQRIIVIPELDMVVVFTADASKGIETGIDPPELGLLHYYIGGACDWELYSGGMYSKYGFSFEVPSSMSLEENGLWWNGTASEVSGMVQALDVLGSSGFGVIWDSTESAHESGAYIDSFFDVLKGFGDDVYYVGTRMSLNKDGHGVMYQDFNLNERGNEYSGVIGSWYCEKSNRVYMLFTLDSSESTTHSDLFTVFQRHLDSFFGH